MWGTLQLWLLPLLVQYNLYQTGSGGGYGWTYYHTTVMGSQTIATTVIRPYMCPSDPTTPPNGVGFSYAYNSNFAVTNYAGNAGIFGTQSVGKISSWYINTIAGYTISNIPDGTSNTVGFGEKYSQLNGAPIYGTPSGADHGSYWAHPAINSVTDTPVFNFEGKGVTLGKGWTWQHYVTNSNNFIQNQPTLVNSNWNYLQAYHSGVLNAAFMDGSVHNISASIAPLTWGVLVDPSDGQPVPSY
jgi:prepilin-type processing-associated H-X9-DG protein